MINEGLGEGGRWREREGEGGSGKERREGMGGKWIAVERGGRRLEMREKMSEEDKERERARERRATGRVAGLADVLRVGLERETTCIHLGETSEARHPGSPERSREMSGGNRSPCSCHT